jgi:hypothetical protein
MLQLLNLKRGPSDEKDIDGIQQYENEAHPWFPCPHGHQRRAPGPQQKAGEGTEKIDGVTPAAMPRAGREDPGKGAVRHGNPNLWQR